MKKIIYTTIFLISLVMLMSESDNMAAQILWTASAFFLFWISGKRLADILNKEGSDE